MIRILNEYPILRGVFLALIGPPLGFLCVVVACPILMIIFVIGLKAWYGVYLVGLCPSIITTVSLLLLDNRLTKKIAVVGAATLIGTLASAGWTLCAAKSAGPVGIISFWPSALAGACGGLLLAIINQGICKAAKSKTGY